MDEIVWGFKCILDALQFLHTKCNFVHGFLSPFAIFVCTNGDWKLGLLDLACKMDVLEEEMMFKQVLSLSSLSLIYPLIYSLSYLSLMFK